MMNTNTMNPAPAVLYAGSYAGADQPGIYVFTFDAGALTAQGQVAGIRNPSYLLAHPNGRWLYAVSETDQEQDGVAGAVWALRLPGAPGQVEPINRQPSGGGWPCHLALDPTGRWLLVANYATGSVGVLPITADGALGPLATVVQHEGRGPHPERQASAHAHSTTFTPDGRFVIVADLGMDALVLYTFDPATGRLAAHGRTPARPGAGPRHLAFHPRGAWLYAANELNNTVAVYEYDSADGALRERQVIETLAPGASESSVAEIRVAPDGGRVYVSNRGADSVTVFACAPDGSLTRVATPSCGGTWPRHFTISPDGRFLVVANQYSGAVTVLPVIDSSAGLGAPIASVPVPGAACVQFAPGTE